MAIIESPQDARVQLAIDPTFAAARVSQRPLEFRSPDGTVIGGHFRIAVTSGLTTILNAGDAIASLRWTDAQRLFALLRLQVSATIGAAFTTAQESSVDLVKLANFTGSDTGGTAITPLGSACKKASGMANSQIADLRVSTTTALGAGTATAEGKALSQLVLPLGNALGASAGGVLLDALAGAEHPLVVGALEGVRVRIAFTQGAVGQVRWTCVMDWAELPIF